MFLGILFGMKRIKFRINDPYAKYTANYSVSYESTDFEESTEEDSVRPKTLDSLKGQKKAITLLQNKVKAFERSGRTPGHILLTGPTGVGKTSLAQAFANDLGVQCHTILSQRLKTWTEITSVLQNIKENDVVFVDEIHGLSDDLQNLLYDIMEEGAYTDIRRRIDRVILPKFTLVGATTHKGELNSALVGRFEEIILMPYSEAEMKQIILDAAERIYDFPLGDDVATYMSKVVLLNPRRAQQLLKSVVEHSDANEGEPATVDTVKEILDLHRRDIYLGLDLLTRRCLVSLYPNKIVGLQTIASSLNEEANTLMFNVEPTLLVKHVCEELGIDGALIAITRGRQLTPQGRLLVEALYDLKERGYFEDEVW